jgi:hypothetical protein
MYIINAILSNWNIILQMLAGLYIVIGAVYMIIGRWD